MLTTLSLGACGGMADDDAPGVAALEQALMDGRADTRSCWDAVGALYAPDAPELGSCTGTLVGPSAVLTAKHCVLLGASMPETDFVFALGADVSEPDATYPIRGWDWEGRVEPNPELTFGTFGSDVGVVWLGAEVEHVSPFSIGGLDDGDLGRRFEIAGYGVRNDAGEIGQRRRGRMTLRGIGGNYAEYAFGGVDGFLTAAATLPGFSELDELALRDAYRRFELIPGYQAVFGGKPGDAQTCQGDSGAPFVTLRRHRPTIVALAGAGDIPSAEHVCDFGSVAAVFGPETLAFLGEVLGQSAFPKVMGSPGRR